MPVIPGVTDSREAMDATLAAAADAGARYVLFGGMTLKDGRQKEHFLSVLSGRPARPGPRVSETVPGRSVGRLRAASTIPGINRTFGELARERRVPAAHPTRALRGHPPRGRSRRRPARADPRHARAGGEELALPYAPRSSSRGRRTARSLQASGRQLAQAIEEIRRTGTAGSTRSCSAVSHQAHDLARRAGGSRSDGRPGRPEVICRMARNATASRKTLRGTG